MSLKENVEVIKEELSAEEQFFEKAVLTERALKKYKKFIYAGLGIIVVAMLAKVGLDIKEQNRIETANAALAQLIKDPSSKEAQATLQQNSQKLYDLWRFSNAIKKDDAKTLAEVASKNDLVISDIATYQNAVSKKDKAQLNAYILKQNGIFKDLALLENGVLLLQEGKTKAAKEKFAMIPNERGLSSLVKVLNHYGVE